MLEKHPLAFKEAAICTFRFLQKSLKSFFMWNGPHLSLSIGGLLFKLINCLERTKVVLLPPAPAFLESLDHPETAELRDI